MKLTQKIATGYIRAKLNILSLVSKKKAAKKAFELFCQPRKRSKKKPSAIFNKGEELSFKSEQHTVRGHRWLPHQSGAALFKKVLIIHGFESNSKNFDRYIGPLLKKGYEILAFDAPAHGESGGKYINLPLYVRTIKTIYEQYGPMQSFLAHSFGGIVVMHFIESVPHDEQTKIALIAPATETKTAIDLFFGFLQLDDEVRKEFDDLIYESAGVNPEHFSIRRAMNNIKASVLWIHDSEDDITPLQDALKVKDDRHKNVEFIITKGLGHRKIYKDNEVMKRVVDFL